MSFTLILIDMDIGRLLVFLFNIHAVMLMDCDSKLIDLAKSKIVNLIGIIIISIYEAKNIPSVLMASSL